jgi:hypothetical protein
LETKLLESLIKLSEELSRLDLTSEALEIKDMIERLYSNGVVEASVSSFASSEEDETVASIPIEELSLLVQENMHNEDFVYNIAETLISLLAEEELEHIRDSISEVVD